MKLKKLQMNLKEKKNKDLIKDETINKIFEKKNEEPIISPQGLENIYKKQLKNKKTKKKFICKMSDLIS